MIKRVASQVTPELRPVEAARFPAAGSFARPVRCHTLSLTECDALAATSCTYMHMHASKKSTDFSGDSVDESGSHLKHGAALLNNNSRCPFWKDACTFFRVRWALDDFTSREVSEGLLRSYSTQHGAAQRGRRKDPRKSWWQERPPQYSGWKGKGWKRKGD